MKPSWDEYYLGIAAAASARSSCVRSKVGAVAVSSNNRIISVGYNDSPAGQPGCEVCPRRTSGVPACTGYDSGPGRCVALHAEQNVVIHADGRGLHGATIYVTRPPCPGCEKLLAGAGVGRIVWPGGEKSY